MFTGLSMSPITDEILERYRDYLLPVKVDDIASRLGVTIRPLDEDLCKDYSGLAFIDSTTGDKLIYYNQCESFNRQRFTIAHELGNLVLEHTVFKDKFYDDFKGNFDDPFEKEANLFASEILMLSAAVLRLAGSKVVRTEHDLAVLFNVSIEAVDWKLRYLHIIE